MISNIRSKTGGETLISQTCKNADLWNGSQNRKKEISNSEISQKLNPKVIFGLKGALFTFLNKPPLFAGAQTAFKIEVNKLLIKVMLKCIYMLIRNQLNKG